LVCARHLSRRAAPRGQRARPLGRGLAGTSRWRRRAKPDGAGRLASFDRKLRRGDLPLGRSRGVLGRRLRPRARNRRPLQSPLAAVLRRRRARRRTKRVRRILLALRPILPLLRTRSVLRPLVLLAVAAAASPSAAEVFVDLGVNASRIESDIANRPDTVSTSESGVHLGVGARRSTENGRAD